MLNRCAGILVMSFLLIGGYVKGDEGLVAHWDFREGTGTIAHDVSGSNLHGDIHGAQWVKSGKGYALKLNGADSYVDCGKNNNLTNLTGDITLLAWIKVMGSPFPDSRTNWHIINCEDYNDAGYMLRVDGATAKLTYRSNQAHSNQFAFSKASLENNTCYQVAVVKKGSAATYYVDATPDIQFPVKDPAPGKTSFKISADAQSFQGLIDDLQIYSRALSTEEIVAQYKQGAKDHEKDTSWFGKIRLSPYPYFSEGKVVVEADFLGILPLQEGETAVVELEKRGDKVVEQTKVTEFPDSGKRDFTFPVSSLSAGEYSVRALLKSGEQTKTEEAYTFRYPPPPSTVPDPSRRTVGVLPTPPAPVPYRVVLQPTGGFTIAVKGRDALPVDSFYSYPKGGENAFTCSSVPGAGMESSWQVRPRQVKPGEFTVTGEGQFYRIDRRITTSPTHITIKDTVTNRTAEAIGILFANRLDIKGNAFGTAHISGRSVSAPARDQIINSNPTLFLGREGLGVGLVALDDVFIVQSKASYDTQTAGIYSDTFALDAHASYTLEWAIYLNGSGDYYDFINQVRKDEGRNNVTVEGGFAFISRGEIPTPDYFKVRNLKYLSLSCLSHATDDPAISIEGIEFMEYPKERAVIKDQFEKLHRGHPELKLMFHVAHSLYANNTPEQKFPDSRVIDANGKQPVYPYTYDSYGYFSKERVDDNWRWWIYYPTMDNSFGKALQRSVDVMVEELGCKGAFMDGFNIAYAGEYTYDRWDGHTAEIDPKTKTIKRKMASVPLLAQPSLVAFVRKMREKGGTVVANGSIVTRTIGKEPIIHDLEVTEGPGVHLAPTSISLGNPAAITCERDIHQDVIKKLKWGNLYFYYGDKDLTYPSAPTQMYPITFEELHSGYVKGKERLITTHSGVYGWAGAADLHFACLYDDRGHLTNHSFCTTVDKAGVRTQIDLRTDQISILRKVPITLRSSSPVNLLIERYDKRGVRLVLNGKGKVELMMGDGDFPVKPGAVYRVMTGTTREVVAGKQGMLTVTLTLNGQIQMKIEIASALK